MLLSNIKISLRKLWMDKSFSGFSILGLSLSIAACTILMMFVRYEKSFDSFREDNIYRVVYHGFQNNIETGKSAQVIPALAPALKNEIPEIESVVRFAHTGPFMADPVMQYDDKQFRESRIYFADENFLSLFSYPMISGSANDALVNPDKVVISKSISEKYFGKINPIGKTLTFYRGERGTTQLTVTGVFEDVPVNSHFHTDFLVSFSTLRFNLDENWDWGNFYVYIKIRSDGSSEVVESKIPAVLKKYVGKELEEYAAGGYTLFYTLQSIHDIHLQSELGGELEPNGDLRTVTFLEVIAVLVMVIAWINYVNFAIAKSSEDSRSISIRKITGSSRGQLITQLLINSAIVNVIAAFIAIALIQVSVPLLNYLGLPSEVSFDWNSMILIMALCFGGVVLAGLYPAIYITRFNPITLLKAKVSRSAVSLYLNKTLIVFQFAASIILITGTIVIFKQLDHMQNRDIGMNINGTLVVKGPAAKDSIYHSKLDFFSNEINKIKGVESFTVSSSIPGEEIHWGRSFSMSDSPENSIGASIVAVDENFFSSYKAVFLAGKNYPEGSLSHRDHIIINETMARELGISNPEQFVGKTILWSEGSKAIPKVILGVVKDFNQQSLHKRVQPIVFTLKKYVYAPWAGEYYSFKIAQENYQQAIPLIQKLWKDVYASNPFDYFFLDTFYNTQYAIENQFGKLLTVFAVLAIFIACLGLFGLTAYMTVVRVKEIGIRKVLGSTSLQIVQLLTRSYLLMVLLAIVIAVPVSFIVMNNWLSRFAYKISISPWILILASAVALLTAILTVGIKSWQASQLNPSETLKYE